MNEQKRRQKIIATLKAKGFRRDSGSSLFAFDGEISVGHSRVSIRIELPDTLFSELPVVKIIDRSDLHLDLVAHLEHLNRVCYGSIELLRLDPADPGGSVLLVLEEVQKALEASLAGRVNDEISRELTRYWDGRTFHILSELPETRSDGSLGIAEGAFSSTKIIFEPKGTKRANSLKSGQHAVWIPTPAELTVQHGIIEPKTVAELDLWWTGNQLLPFVNTRDLHRTLLEGKAVIVAAPNAIVGFDLAPSPGVGRLLAEGRSRHSFRMKFLADNGQKVDLNRLIGVDCSLDYVGARNAGERHAPLKGKNIALIGCGTIGSHLARFLVQSGAGNNSTLTLVDIETLSPGNLGRHLLNFSDVGARKSDALAAELSRFHPDVNVSSIQGKAQFVWPRILDADLVVDAAGVESLSEYLNIKAVERRRSGENTAILHAFIWQNGIAVQSFLNNGNGLACYRCLKPEKTWAHDPRKEVKAKPQVVLNRCGDGPYLPFSVSASVSAAALALEATLDFFRGKPGPTLRTRTLDHEAAKQIKDGKPAQHSRCPICLP